MGIKVRRANGTDDHIKGDAEASVHQGDLKVYEKGTENLLGGYPKGAWQRWWDDAVEIGEGGNTPLVG